MSKRFLFLLAFLIPLLSVGQLDVKPNYTKPFFQGSVEINDTIQVDNIMQTSNGGIIKAANGNAFLDLRSGGVDNVLKLNGGSDFFEIGNNMATFSTGAAFVDAYLTFNTFNSSGIGLGVFKGDFSKFGTFTIAPNDLADATGGATPSYPIFLGSESCVIKQNVVNSNVVGGANTIGYSNNTAYSNQFGFNTGEGFETILTYTTATQNNTFTLPNSSGTIATLSDITNGVYDGNGTIPTTTRSNITDKWIINTSSLLGGITLNETSGNLPNVLVFATGGSIGVTGTPKLQIGVSQGNSQFLTGTTAGDAVCEIPQKLFIGGPLLPTMVVDAPNRSVGIGTTTPDASSVLDVTSTTKGFLPPRMTTGQRDAILSPAFGLIIYNITEEKLQGLKGNGDWKNLH